MRFLVMRNCITVRIMIALSTSRNALYGLSDPSLVLNASRGPRQNPAGSCDLILPIIYGNEKANDTLLTWSNRKHNKVSSFSCSHNCYVVFVRAFTDNVLCVEYGRILGLFYNDDLASPVCLSFPSRSLTSKLLNVGSLLNRINKQVTPLGKR